MKKITHLKIKIRPSDGYGIFHDSRGDVAKLAEAVNILIEKQNEVIETMNSLIESKK